MLDSTGVEGTMSKAFDLQKTLQISNMQDTSNEGTPDRIEIEGWTFITAALNLYGITWAIAAIFAIMIADHLSLPGSDNDYYLFMLIFAAITIPLACVPIIDQCWVQLCFLATQTVMVLLMIGTVLVGYVSSVPQFGSQVGAVKDVPLADFTNLIGCDSTLCLFDSLPVCCSGHVGSECQQNDYAQDNQFGSHIHLHYEPSRGPHCAHFLWQGRNMGIEQSKLAQLSWRNMGWEWKYPRWTSGMGKFYCQLHHLVCSN